MASPLDNIFGTQEEEKDQLKNPANSSQSRTVSADPLENIFANKTAPTPKQVQVETAVKKEEPKKSLFDKAVSVVGKVATSVGNFFSEQNRKNEESSLKMRELMYGKGTIVKDPVTGKNTYTTPRLEAFNNAKTPEEKAKVLEEANQDVPLIKFLNTDTGKKITGTIYESTSNIPLKTIARIKSLGDDTYDEAYSALVAKSKDPENNRFERIMYGLQDSGIQSAIGALLAVGTSVLAKNPNAGRAVSLAYFAPISAESQRADNEQGNVTSLGNIAIDTVGDTLISGFAESALKTVIKEGGEAGFKAFLKQMGKGFVVEGGTEPTQTFLKYANDYKNARTEAQRQEVVAKVTEYVKSGGMVDEFLIGGISGAGITGVATGVGKATGMNAQVDPSLQSDGTGGGTPPPSGGSSGGSKRGELNIDFSEVRDEISTLEQAVRDNPSDQNSLQRLSVATDQLNDYQQAVKQRPVYIADETQETPLATVETVRYPDGKFSYSFSANTESNSVQSPFLNTETFKTEKKAIEAGKKAILDWVNSKIATAEGVELAKLNEIKSEIENPTKPNGVKVSLNRDGEVSQETINKGFKGASDFITKKGLDANSVMVIDDTNFIVENTAGNKAVLTELPLSAFGNPKFETLNQDKYEAGRKITDPIEVTQLADGSYKITEGANRFTQAVANKDKTIPVILERSEVADTKKDKKTSKNTEKDDAKKSDKVSKNVEKTSAGVYRVTQYNAQGEAKGKAEARFTKSKRNGKMFFEVTKDGERIERLPLDKAKKKYETTDRPTMVERAVNGTKNADGNWELRQSNAPVIRNTTQNQVEKKPVKTKGQVRNSKAFQRVQERLGEYADIDVNYNKLNLADDTARALEFIEKNPKEAKRIALGMQGAPEGVTETAISIALAEQASEKKDFALQAQLERSRSLRQTRRGQEIVSERGRFNENSPHFFMQQVLASRIEKASKEKFRFLTKKKGERSTKTVDGKIREGTDSIKKTVRTKLSASQLAQNVIDSLTC